MENHADLSSLLFPELLAFAGVPKAEAPQPVPPLGGELTETDFLALLTEQQPMLPVLPAHIPLQRQSLPPSGQPLPLPIPLRGLVPQSPTPSLTPAIATNPVTAEPVLAAAEKPVAVRVTDPLVPPPPTQSAKEPSTDLARLPVQTAPPLPTAAPEPSTRLPRQRNGTQPSPTNLVLPETPLRAVVQTPSPSYGGTQPGLQDPVTSQSAEVSALTHSLERMELPEPRSVERVAQTPSVVSLTAPVTTNVAQSDGPVMSTQPAPLPSADVEFPERIADSVRLLATRQGGEMRIRLNPPELGHLEVKVSVSDEQTFVSITASNSLSKEVLEQHLGRLRSLLEDAGLNLADAEVSSERHSQHQASQPGAEIDPARVAEPPIEAQVNKPSQAPPQSGVDLFA